jgi:AraC family chemosensory pili system transcriptional regulator ChpD
MSFFRRQLPGLEIAFLDCTGRSFAKHAHDEFVIGANVVGREHIWLDGRSHEAQTSEVTVYNPGQVQSGDARDLTWAFFSLYVEVGWFGSHFGIQKEMAFERPVLAGHAYADAVRSLGQAALFGDLNDEETGERALFVLERLVERFSAAKVSQSISGAATHSATIRDRLLDEMVAPPSMGSLAASVGLTSVQLVRAFTREYGLPPRQWLNVQRLIRARRILQNGLTDLAELSLDLGFADQSHFTRRFVAMYGVTPAVYARG